MLVVSVSITFLQAQKGMPRTGYNDSREDWDGLLDHFREMYRGSISLI